MKTSKLRKSAKNQPCQVRIPGVCSYESDTVCLAHLPGAGWALKSLDIHGAYCCQKCHDVLDGRVKSLYKKDELKLYHLEAVIRTQEIMVKDNLIRFDK